MIGTVRERLTADRTYYVSATGDNSNDGLTAGTPLLTVQKAVEIIVSTLDLGGRTVTIQLANGTYTTPTVFSGSWTGGGAIIIKGNAASPQSVIVNTTSTHCFAVTAVLGGTLTLQDMELRTTTSTGHCIHNVGLAIVNFNNIRFGATGGNGYHINCAGSGSIVQCVSGAYSIVGNAYAHITLNSGGYVGVVLTTVTVSAGLTFTRFIWGLISGMANFYNSTFSTNVATGQRYYAEGNAMLYVAGAGATFFPGSTAGATSSGGQYA